MATREESAVVEFYRNKNIFLTGGSGFVGLAIIEKALRTLETGNIYVLLRPKRGKSIEERLAYLTKNAVFDTLLAAQPDNAKLFSKLIPIAGDVGEPNLGLSQADRKLLTDNVHVIIHSAASLDFDQPLTTTFRINTLGTRQVVQLARECHHAAAFVHVSSAFVNSFILNTEEILYPPPADLREVEEMVANLSEKEIIARTPGLLKDHPNTYTFTKHFAEHEANSLAGAVPTAIVRPSMIQTALYEPVPGWTASKNGPQGFMMGALKGVVRRLPVAKKNISDCIPVDMVVNGILVAAQHVAAKNDGQLAIFHATTSTCNPFRWSYVLHNVQNILDQNALTTSVWYPRVKLVDSMRQFFLSTIFVHFLPALLLDTVLRLAGNRPILWRLHTRVWHSVRLLDKFVYMQWFFDNKGTLALHEALSPLDQRLFYMDPRVIDWETYATQMVRGVRRFMYREPNENLPAALRRNQFMFALHVLLRIALYCAFWWLVKSVLGMGWSQTSISLPLGYVLLNLL